VTLTDVPQGIRLVPRFTYEVTAGMTIAQAIAHADTVGGDWTILLYADTYAEGELTPNGGADITIKAMGEGRVTIAPVAAPATAVIVSGFNLTLENVIVTAPDATRPALRVTGGTCDILGCTLSGVAGGNCIEQVGGVINMKSSETVDGDIDLRDAACTMHITHCDISTTGGNFITANGAGATVVMTVTLDFSPFNGATFGLAATGACTYFFEHVTGMGTVTDASLLGTGTIRECHIAGVGLLKTGTTDWQVFNSFVTNLSNNNATGTIEAFGGIIQAFAGATGSVVWWLNAHEIKVLPVPTSPTDTIIAWALAAAAAGGVAIYLAPGDYEEDSLVAVDDCIIIGAGLTAASGSVITINSANAMLTCGAVQFSIQNCRIIQQGAGDCFDVTDAAGVLHLDTVVFGSGGQSAHLTAGTLEGCNCTVTAGNIQMDTAACTLTARLWDITANVVTGDAFGHTLVLEDCHFHGNTITNAATGDCDIHMHRCVEILAFTDASLVGTVFIEHCSITTATKTGTSPWVVRISNIAFLSNTDATGAITVYAGMILAITRAVGPIVWWWDGNTLKVIPSGTITDTVIGWAVAAASAGDTILIHPGTYQEVVTLVAGVNLVGIDKDNCIINGTAVTLIIAATGCRIANLTLNPTATGGNAIGIECNDAALTIEDLDINLVRTNNNAYAISELTNNTARVIHLRNVRVTSDTDTNEFCVWSNQANKTWYVENCWMQAGDFALRIEAASTVHSSNNHWESTSSVSAIAIDGATLRLHNDVILGAIARTSGVITYKNANQQYEVWAGMLIQDAITAAAAETTAPSVTVPYTVLIHPGMYNEVITCAAGVDLKGIGPKNSVIIWQANADVIILADNVDLQNFTVRLVTPDVGRRLIYDNSVACTVRVTDLLLQITTPSTFAHVVFSLKGAGNYTIEGCSYRIAGTGASLGVQNVDNAATIHLVNNDFQFDNTNAWHILSSVAGTWTGGGNRWAGTCPLFNVSLGTITLDNDTGVCTGTSSVTGGTVTMRTGRNSYEVLPGMQIQHAIAANRYIYVHPGTFMLSSTLSITVSNLTIQGAGRQTIITTATDNLDIIYALGGSGIELTNVILRDFLVRGFETGNKNDLGIYLQYVDDSKIINVWSEHNGESGIRILNCDNNEIEGSHAFSNTYCGIEVITSTGLKIISCVCHSNTAWGILLENSDDCSITASSCDDNTSSGIYLTSSDRVTLESAHCDNNGANGFHMKQSDHCSVTGGQFNNNTADGIHIAGNDTENADYNIVTGVVSTGNGGSGIEISEVGAGQANKNLIMANQLLGNTTAALTDGGTGTVHQTAAGDAYNVIA